MGLFDRYDPTRAINAMEVAQAQAEVEGMRLEVSHLSYELREAKEDLLKVADAFDNVGWAPLTREQATEMPLETVKKAAITCRALYTMNPFVNRGVNARVTYVWGRGVSFDGVDKIADKLSIYRKKLFTDAAYAELERVLATDGNAFTLLPTDENPNQDAVVTRVPLEQIMSAVSNPDDIEDIWYYRREWSVRKTDGSTGDVREVKMVKYYPSMEYYERLKKQNRNLPRRWRDAGVEQGYVIHHVAVNKQIGWRWGVPDVLPVVFWAKAYKEYLEDNATLVKAYSRIAWSIQAGSGQAAASAAAQVMTPPTRDPMTGELRNIGGTAVSGPGTVATPVAPTGSQVDFDKGSALAAAIASGLQVSKVVITSDPGSGNRATAETLDLPTLKAMESRQRLHTERFLDLFEFWGVQVMPLTGKNEREVQEAANDERARPSESSGPGHAIVTWPQIESDSTKDRIAAIGTATELGVIYKQEARKDALDTLGIAPYKPWDVLPTMEDDPMAMQKAEQEEKRFEAQQEQASVIAKQGVAGGVAAKGGAQTSNNEARDNRKADSNNR